MKLLISFFLFGTTLLFFSCIKPCDETPSSKVAGFSIDFFDLSDKDYLYRYYRPPLPGYNKDSLVISDDIGRIFKLRISHQQNPDSSLQVFDRFSFGPIYYIPTDQNSFTQEITRKFYIRYNETERDTLVCVFKNRETKCSEEFDYVKFYYRGNLISETNNNFGIRPIKLNKP